MGVRPWTDPVDSSTEREFLTNLGTRGARQQDPHEVFLYNAYNESNGKGKEFVVTCLGRLDLSAGGDGADVHYQDFVLGQFLYLDSQSLE